MDEKVSNMSVKQLKECIAAAGLSHADCSEKSELQARAASALLGLSAFNRSAAHAYHEAKTASSLQGSEVRLFCICLNCNLSANSFCVSDGLSSVFKHVRLWDWLVWFCCLVVICSRSKVSYRAFSEFE